MDIDSRTKAIGGLFEAGGLFEVGGLVEAGAYNLYEACRRKSPLSKLLVSKILKQHFFAALQCNVEPERRQKSIKYFEIFDVHMPYKSDRLIIRQ